jgi:hypothetical protein
MQLTLEIAESGTPEVIYDGALVDDMETGFLDFAANIGGRYETLARRWWFEKGREYVEDGLEPIYSLFDHTTLHVWRVLQGEPTS